MNSFKNCRYQCSIIINDNNEGKLVGARYAIVAANNHYATKVVNTMIDDPKITNMVTRAAILIISRELRVAILIISSFCSYRDTYPKVSDFINVCL